MPETHPAPPPTPPVPEALNGVFMNFVLRYVADFGPVVGTVYGTGAGD